MDNMGVLRAPVVCATLAVVCCLVHLYAPSALPFADVSVPHERADSDYVASQVQQAYAQVINNPVRHDKLEPGQWVKYTYWIDVYGDDSLVKTLENLADSTKKQFRETTGFDIDNIIWIKYTVSDISGTIVTFDRHGKFASDPETREKFTSGDTSEEILSNIFEKELKPKQYDLSEFHPRTFFVMPTSLEFGSKFNGGPEIGDITFNSIEEETIWFKGKINSFNAHKVFTKDIRLGVVENTFEFDVAAFYDFDRQTGILVEKSTDIWVTNLNTRESGSITHTMRAVERSDPPKSPDLDRPINDRNEILERLSYFFVESSNSEFLFTNGVDSMGTPKRTSFDIIRVSDGHELGALIIHGDEKISSIRTATLIGGNVGLMQSDRVHGQVLLSLLPVATGCEILVPDHLDLYMENTDKDSASTQIMCGDIAVTRSWAETDKGFGLGIFAQEIAFDKNTKPQENAPAEQMQPPAQPQPEQNPPIPLPATAPNESEGGGCLIATAAFDSELEPQIQSMRELRDDIVMSTSSGAAFMSGFNAVYYSFSPTVADLEREHPAFRETIRAFITPMIYSLSILGATEVDSELDVIAYGSAVLLLNAGLYVAAPTAAVIVAAKKMRRL